MKIHIKSGRLIDPSLSLDKITDLFISDNNIVGHHTAPSGFTADKTIDANQQWVIPGLIDISFNVTSNSAITPAARLARKAGITSLCCLPLMQPVVDSPVIAQTILQQGLTNDTARVFPIGALTQALNGQQLSAMSALKEAGCVALSNVRCPIIDTTILRHAFDYAATFDLPIIHYPADPYLSQGYVHEGQASMRLGLPGIPATSETIDLARVLLLQQETGVRLHIARLSTALGVEMIAQAKATSSGISADVAIHHLFLTENDVLDFSGNCHLQPPLRSLLDQKALIEGVKNGVIDIICADHFEVDIADKCAPFAQTKPGIYGLPTLLPLTLELATRNKIALNTLINAVCYNPAKLINQLLGTLQVGRPADLCIVDPQSRCEINLDEMINPFAAWPLMGKVSIL